MLKKIWAIFLLLPIFCVGQNAKTDSLKRVFKNAKNDITKCCVINAMIDAEENENIRKKYNDELKDICERNLKLISQDHTDYKIYQKYYAIYKYNLGFYFLLNGDFKNAITDHFDCLKIREQLHDSFGVAQSFNLISIIYKEDGDFTKAIYYADKSLQINKQLGNDDKVANTLNNLGLIYTMQGDIKTALDYYFNSLKIHEQKNNLSGEALLLNNIGLVYKEQGENKRAQEYFTKSLKLNEQINNKDGTAYSLTNLGLIFQELGETNKAIDCYNKALALYQEIEMTEGVAQLLKEIGVVYENTGKLEKALNYYEKSYRVLNSINDKSGLAILLNRIGSIYEKRGLIEQALTNYKNGMLLCKEAGSLESIRDAAKSLFSIYKKTNNLKLALENYELYITIRDSIFNKETQKASIKSQFKYEFDKKEIELKAQAKIEQQKSEAKIKFQKLMLYSILGCVLLLMIISFFIFKNYNQKKEAATNNAIQKAEEEERARLAQDLHDDLGGTLSALKLNLTANAVSTSSLTSTLSLDTSVAVLDKAIADLRSISHKLMPVNFNVAGLNKSLMHYIQHIKKPQIEFVFNGNDALIKIETQLTIYRITLELLTNVVKHAQAKNCTLQCIMFTNFIRIFIEDDGIGFNVDESKSGIGLRNIKNRVEQIKGKMQLQSNLNGTIVNIEIPI